VSRILVEDIAHVRAAAPEISRLAGKSVLVTGAAGFLGYELVHVLADSMERGEGPASLILLDSFLFGEPKWLRQLAMRSGIHIRRFDIAHDRLATLEMRPADHIFHMASIASPTFYRKHPIETIDANVWGLRNLLEAMRDAPPEGFVFFSSSEVYGDPSPEAIPTPESYRGNVSCDGPRACYDEAKRFGETLCRVFSEVHGIPATVVRPFNNYGPGMSPNDRRAPADFAHAVLTGEDIVLLSDGTPTRTFCYIADAIAGYLQALLHGRANTFNIGIERPEISVRRLAEIFAEAGREILGYDGEVVLRPPPDAKYLADNPNRRAPDVSKARHVLGFSPKIDVEEGVRRYIAHLAEVGRS